MKNKKNVLLIALAVVVIAALAFIAVHMVSLDVVETKTTEVVTVTGEDVPAEQETAAAAELEGEEEMIEIVEISGTITEITDEYVMIDAGEMGMIQANTSVDTLIEGVEELAVGQTAVILYDGKMTRSLPAQITALKIGVYTLRGEVTEIGEGVITVKNADTQEDVILTLPQDAMQVAVGDQIIAYTTGVSTMSLPPQMNAIAVEQMEIEEIEAETADPAENG